MKRLIKEYFKFLLCKHDGGDWDWKVQFQHCKKCCANRIRVPSGDVLAMEEWSKWRFKNYKPFPQSKKED